MKKIAAVMFVLFSGAGYAGDYFTCTVALEHGKLDRYIFSTNGSHATERFVEVEADDDILWGYQFEIDVKSVTGSGDHYELNGIIPDGQLTDINLVVDKDANGQYVATYKRGSGSNPQTGNASCKRSDAVYHHKNDFNFFTFSMIPKSGIKCGKNNGVLDFVIDFKSKKVWGLMGQLPSGNYSGGEYYILNFEETEENKYLILATEKKFTVSKNYRIRLKLDAASNEWKYSLTDLNNEKTKSGVCGVF